jgi:hypothetical protein
MADSEHPPKSSFNDGFYTTSGPNPFPEGDTYQPLWIKAGGLAAEEEALVLSEIRDRKPADRAQRPAWILESSSRLFDLLAKYLLLALASDGAIATTMTRHEVFSRLLEAVLDDFAEKEQAMFAALRNAEQSFPAAQQFVTMDSMLPALRSRLVDRMSHWTRERSLLGDAARVSEKERRIAERVAAAEIRFFMRGRVQEAQPVALGRNRIRQLLNEKRWTPRRWAELAGVDPSAAYGYLSGRSNPRPETRKSLAGALGIPIDDFPA